MSMQIHTKRHEHTPIYGVINYRFESYRNKIWGQFSKNLLIFISLTETNKHTDILTQLTMTKPYFTMDNVSP